VILEQYYVHKISRSLLYKRRSYELIEVDGLFMKKKFISLVFAICSSFRVFSLS
jgi:hypothetical protein